MRRLAQPRAGRCCILLLAACGCNFMINPERVDGLMRCETDDDCDQPEDSRYVRQCMLSDDVDTSGGFLDVEKVCLAVFRPLSCKAGTYPNSRFEKLYNAARADGGSLYDNACDFGQQGCEPRLDGDVGCDEGLVEHPQTGFCDDEDPLTPPALRPETWVAGQDVADQFCRSYFCDIEFTCDTSGKAKICTPCRLGGQYGNGGCGDLYLGGDPSPVYQSHEELVDACNGADSMPEDVFIGPLYEPPPEMPDM